jgi:hypothetical protein
LRIKTSDSRIKACLARIITSFPCIKTPRSNKSPVLRIKRSISRIKTSDSRIIVCLVRIKTSFLCIKTPLSNKKSCAANKKINFANKNLRFANKSVPSANKNLKYPLKSQNTPQLDNQSIVSILKKTLFKEMKIHLIKSLIFPLKLVNLVYIIWKTLLIYHFSHLPTY